MTEPAARLLVVHVKCVDTDRADEWSDWYDNVHLPDLLDGIEGDASASRWSLLEPPEPGRPGLGFSHVTVFRFGVPGALEDLERRAVRLRAESRVHHTHCVIGASAWRPHGRWTSMSAEAGSRTGLILAEVLPADPATESEWDAWYEDQHLPDMLATGAFAAGTRWERVPRRAFGANHLTLYEIEGIEVGAAVEISARAMPGLVAQDRKFPGHTGGLTLVLEPVGSTGSG